jgi:hypothetical protein
MRQITADSDEFGRAFEYLLIEEVRVYLSYREKNLPIAFWLCTSKRTIVPKNNSTHCPSPRLSKTDNDRSPAPSV